MNNQKYVQKDNFTSKSYTEKIDSKNNTSKKLDLKKILEMEKEVNLILKTKNELEARELESLNNKNRM